MLTNPFSAKASVQIDVKAQGSQQLVVILSLLAMASLAVGFFFLWHTHAQSYIPLLFGGMLVIAALYCHGKSQAMLDLQGVGQTKISRDAKGIKIETNVQTLLTPQASNVLERLVGTISFREQLPEPDGLVGLQHMPDTSAEAQRLARERVAKANQEADDLRSAAVRELAPPVDDHKTITLPPDHAAPIKAADRPAP